MKLSTGLRNYMMATGAFKGAMDGSVIQIYSGSAPTSPDDAVPGTAVLLCTVSVNGDGTGLTFAQGGSAGLLVKTPAEAWQGTNLAGGTASWFRMVAPADTGAASTTAVRVQGSVAQAGADMNFTSVALAAGAVQTVDYFSVVLPE